MTETNDKVFILEEYYDRHIKHNNKITKTDKNIIELNSSISTQKDSFMNLCSEIRDFFSQEWERENGSSNKDSTDKLLMRQKRAIIGYENDVNFFRSKINEYIKDRKISCWYPNWYDDLVSAVFHENWGFAGIQQWRNMKSQSAKIIGERIYFLINGKQVLQEQRISRDRLNQLITALMLKDPYLRIKDGTAEVFTLDGIRIKIYTELGQDNEGVAIEPVLVFRNPIMETLTFEEWAKKGSIPSSMIPMLKAMVSVRYNTVALGPVSTGKTTWVQTWGRYKDPSLEGIRVQTDPEVISSKINPNSPIMDIVADGDRLKRLMKDLVRGDGDYISMLESRDGTQAKIALKSVSKGTRDSEMTFHSSDPIDFCYDFAEEIISEFGGDMYTTIIKVAKGFHFLFEFCKLKDKSQKRLKGIYEVRFNRRTFEVTIHQIVKYNFEADDWSFKCDIGNDKKELAYETDIDAFNIFKSELEKLEQINAIESENVFVPPYFKLRS